MGTHMIVKECHPHDNEINTFVASIEHFFSEIYTWNYYSIFLNDSDNVYQMFPFTKQKLFTDLSAHPYSMLSFEVKVILYLIQTSPLCIHRMLATYCKCNYLKGGRDWWSLELRLSF